MQISALRIGLVSASLLLGFSAQSAMAELTSISSTSEFYDYYGSDFSSEAQTFVDSLYSNLTPYFGADGILKAAEDGFVPMTPEAKFHGTHWFNPAQVYDFVADPDKPAGLNFNENNELVAVFWGETKYDSIEQAVQSFSAFPSEALPAVYTNYKETNRRQAPTILEPFGSLASWHSHENIVIENVGARDATTGFYDGEAINFRQSLTDENFIAEIFQALGDDSKIAAPFEVDTGRYPPFNTAVHPGFYMAHMWVGLGNPDGLFSGEHKAVSPNGLDEHETFEDGSEGHGHGGHSPGHSGDSPQQVPEPSGLVGLIALAALALVGRKRRQVLH